LAVAPLLLCCNIIDLRLNKMSAAHESETQQHRLLPRPTGHYVRCFMSVEMLTDEWVT